MCFLNYSERYAAYKLLCIIDILSMTQIIDNIYLGDCYDSKNVDNKFGLIVNCTPDLPFYSNSTINLRLAVSDFGNPNEIAIMINELPLIFDEINNYNGNILVHCQAGHSRSPSVIAAYLLTKQPNLTVDEAIQLVKSRDNNAFFSGVKF